MAEISWDSYILKSLPEDEDTFLIKDTSGKTNKRITLEALWAWIENKIETENLSPMLYSGSGAHNAIYRGKSLGSSVSSDHYSAISSGTFEDLYIGDYWTIGGVNWRIAAFDYYLNCGDTNTLTHHAVIVPDSVLYNYVMNDTDITTGGYKGSKMYTEGLSQAKSTIESAFSNHIFGHRIYISNAMEEGRPSENVWVDSEVELMNENMVYGSRQFSPVSNGVTVPANQTIEKTQLPLFALEPSRICNRNTYWLRDPVSTSAFAFVNYTGYVGFSQSSGSYGVRPVFAIS